MKFEWDEHKNNLNIQKHHISFDEAKMIFANEILTRVDDRFEYDETREISLGRIYDIIIIVVVHTTRDDRIRIISARKANKTEREIYNQFIRER